jgi:hypothetical protein
LPEGAVYTGLCAALANAVFGVGPTGPGLAFDARTAPVVCAVAVGVVARDGARISFAGADGSLTCPPVAVEISFAEDARARAGPALPSTVEVWVLVAWLDAFR